jgi:hypothetical protein
MLSQIYKHLILRVLRKVLLGYAQTYVTHLRFILRRFQRLSLSGRVIKEQEMERVLKMAVMA